MIKRMRPKVYKKIKLHKHYSSDQLIDNSDNYPILLLSPCAILCSAFINNAWFAYYPKREKNKPVSEFQMWKLKLDLCVARYFDIFCTVLS